MKAGRCNSPPFEECYTRRNHFSTECRDVGCLQCVNQFWFFPLMSINWHPFCWKMFFHAASIKAWVKNHVFFSLFVALGRDRIVKTERSGTLFHIVVCLLRPLLVVSFYSFSLKGDVNNIIEISVSVCQEEISKIPIGVIPLGTHNSFCNRLFGNKHVAEAR